MWEYLSRVDMALVVRSGICQKAGTLGLIYPTTHLQAIIDEIYAWTCAELEL